MAEHYLDDRVTQPFWDRDVKPRVRIESGDVVTFECPEPCGQVTPDWTSKDLRRWDTSRVHALIGSVWVNGAGPGDALRIEVLDMQHKGWGWSAHLPGFGLLADEFDFPYLHHWSLDEQWCHFGKRDIAVPLRPFVGCIGVAPAESGRLDTIPPRGNGGNFDVPQLTVGSTLWLPVLVEGALLACGDCHAAQGEGEVGGTAVEAPMRVTLRITTQRGEGDRAMRLQPAPTQRAAAEPCHVTIAVGPDVHECSRNAVRDMIDWLCRRYELSRSEGLMLCTAAGDLAVSQIVNAPNWTVAFTMRL